MAVTVPHYKIRETGSGRFAITVISQTGATVMTTHYGDRASAEAAARGMIPDCPDSDAAAAELGWTAAYGANAPPAAPSPKNAKPQSPSAEARSKATSSMPTTTKKTQRQLELDAIADVTRSHGPIAAARYAKALADAKRPTARAGERAAAEPPGELDRAFGTEHARPLVEHRGCTSTFNARGMR
jgi:hypothetical protein